MLVPLVLGWEVCCALYEKHERHVLFRRALAESRQRGKPMLVVGEPDGEYPCPPPPGVLVDLRERSVCPRYVRTSVERMPMFRDRQFGAAFCSHVIEHVERPLDALQELHRVADSVFISYPRPWRIATYLVPGHTWLMVPDRSGGFAFYRMRTRSNVPNRYGISGMTSAEWSWQQHCVSPGPSIVELDRCAPTWPYPA